MQLYTNRLSNNGRRVHVALLEKGIDAEIVPVQLNGDQLTPEFLAMNPFHHVPVLVDDGFTVIESLAILDYIEAQYPTPPLMPTEPKAIARVRMIEMVQVHEMTPLMYPQLKAKVGIEVPAEVLEQTTTKMATVLQFHEQHLGEDFFVPGQFTFADIVAGVSITILDAFLGVDLTPYPRISAWYDRLSSRPSWEATQPTPMEVMAFLPRIRTALQRHG
ncbi:MAG: glutathione S-transferase family protein [Spirulina sp. DLM2.Bin59]|nr:MAG: glutathione S-transferase family protein [Spirulina sp. DLM2.Bin59]